MQELEQVSSSLEENKAFFQEKFNANCNNKLDTPW